ncbi:unnamed protein product [Diamesa serratosioi]
MGHLIKKYCLLAVLTINLVSARFCENGNHRCLPPKECCAQGCCYLYSPPKSAPKTPPVNDNVLNLFFISHWYFWCFLFAVVLALLLFCSLWKKRRQFCSGWGSSSNHHSQSEGDSAGSCYAPPHYSRCSSFHHAPPPYTEVTSKPDLYPLVFSYTNDNSKNGNNGANYLMVQYFRNYIVRPIGSLSASNNSTVDSLSSSFICTANEANTLIPPPYSSAASPDDLSMTLQNYAIPRSASQQAYMNDAANILIENQHLTGNSSTLANLNSPGSPPRATSPTLEVKELLEQIRQLKNTNFSNEDLHLSEEKPQHHTIDMEYQSIPGTSSDMTTSSLRTALKRPTSLNNKRKFFNMKNRSVYLPISNNSTYSTSPNGTSFATSINNNIKSLRSPIAGSGGAMSFMGKTRRNRTGWISKSAPTTPGSMPVNFMSDDSPLLNEQDEETETEQN